MVTIFYNLNDNNLNVIVSKIDQMNFNFSFHDQPRIHSWNIFLAAWVPHQTEAPKLNGKRWILMTYLVDFFHSFTGLVWLPQTTLVEAHWCNVTSDCLRIQSFFLSMVFFIIYACLLSWTIMIFDTAICRWLVQDSFLHNMTCTALCALLS